MCEDRDAYRYTAEKKKIVECHLFNCLCANPSNRVEPQPAARREFRQTRKR